MGVPAVPRPVGPADGDTGTLSESRRSRTIPVVVVTGFLGAGKTTLLRGMLEDDGAARLAVIVNEFGSVGIDRDLLRGDEDIVELANGCMCCENRGDLARTIGELLRRVRSFDALVVETSGLADPLGVATVLVSYDFDDELLLSSVITVVDAENFDRNLDHAEAAYQQLVSADVFVVGKADLVSPRTVDVLVSRLGLLNEAAPALVSDHGRVAREVVLQPPTSPAVWRRGGESVTASTNGFSSFSWSERRAVDLGRFIQWVEDLPVAVCRVKAIVARGDQTYAVHRVGARVTVLGDSDRDRPRADDSTRVTLIGRDLVPDEYAPQLLDMTM